LYVILPGKTSVIFAVLETFMDPLSRGLIVP